MSIEQPMDDMQIDLVVKQFCAQCRKSWFAKAAALAIPPFGDPIAAYLERNDDAELLKAIAEMIKSQRKGLFQEMEQFLRSKHHENTSEQNTGAYVISIGSANAEMVVTCGQNEMTLGGKQDVEIEDCMGGSALNVAMRLLGYKCPCVPVVHLGKDDVGRKIRDCLQQNAKRAKLPDIIQELVSSNDLLDLRKRTPTSVILIQNGHRTIFRQKPCGGGSFVELLRSKLYEIEDKLGSPPSVVFIGHIQSDTDNPDRLGECTRLVLEKYAGTDTLIYAAFGKTQLNLRWEGWEDVLRYIHVFQMNAHEAKHFLGDGATPLREIIDRFREIGTNLIITLDQCGSVAMHHDNNRALIARPLLFGAVRDSTGAGDAFAAGMISVLRTCGRKFSLDEFGKAIEAANIWAACACMNYGGVGHQPEMEMAEFQKRFSDNIYRFQPELRELDYCNELLDLLDRVYS